MNLHSNGRSSKARQTGGPCTAIRGRGWMLRPSRAEQRGSTGERPVDPLASGRCNARVGFPAPGAPCCEDNFPPARQSRQARNPEPMAVPCRGFLPPTIAVSLPPPAASGRRHVGARRGLGCFPKGDGVLFLLIAFLLLPAVAFCAYMADREIRLLDDEIRGKR